MSTASPISAVTCTADEVELPAVGLRPVTSREAAQPGPRIRSPNRAAATVVEAREIERLEACRASLEQHASRRSRVIADDVGCGAAVARRPRIRDRHAVAARRSAILRLARRRRDGQRAPPTRGESDRVVAVAGGTRVSINTSAPPPIRPPTVSARRLERIAEPTRARTRAPGTRSAAPASLAPRSSGSCASPRSPRIPPAR